MADTQFDFRDRLFSISSLDDSSVEQHADYFNGLKTQERDYYENLFSSDSEDEDADSVLTESTSNSKSHPLQTQEDSQNNVFIENLIENLHKFENEEKMNSNSNIFISSDTSQESIRSLTSTASVENLDTTANPISAWFSDPIIESRINNVSSFLDDHEISQLLEGHIVIPPQDPREVQEKVNEDKIACFNVRNKYDHNSAAELFAQENLAFLAIQEPFCSRHKVSESWKAYRALELQSTRIKCFETPYQVVMFDTWKWGGKVLYPFQSLQYGRVTSIAFDFHNNQKLGIISIYAPAKVYSSSQASDPNSNLKVTSDCVEKIKKKWEAEHHDIQILILGDLQETISISDRDNIGKYRQEQSENGILHLTKDSHESIVRKISGAKEYITRFGTEGGRGIDHILIPTNSPMSTWVVDAKVERQKGAVFFPSDHSMISCTFKRFSQNNNESGHLKTRYDFKKVCSIKLKQSGSFGECLELDDRQFKGCRSFQEQKVLFDKIRKLTSNSTNFTKSHLDHLQQRISKLYTALWEAGVTQHVDGSENRLVDIAEDHALELAYVLKKFNEGVKEAMEEWELATEFNANDKAGKIRGNLRRKKGFKLFANLPTTTKLYYLKKKILAKSKLVKQKMYWLDEKKIRKKHNAEEASNAEFWEGFTDIVNCDKVVEAANVIHALIMTETEERSTQLEAMQFKKFEAKLAKAQEKTKRFKKPNMAQPNEVKSNSLDIDNKITKKINYWLQRSNCGQCFNVESPNTTYESLSGNQLSDWSKCIDDVLYQDLDIDKEADLDSMKNILETAKKDLQRIYGSITKMQSKYKQDLLIYFLSSGKISDFTRKVLPKSRSAPSTHSTIWDAGKGDFRTCVDEAEEMIATSEFHGKWMANTTAKEVCAYAKLTRKGRLGCRGIQLNPNRKVSRRDLDTLLPNHKRLSKKTKAAFLAAHNEHTANLFQEPAEDRRELFYPFYLNSSKGDMNEDDDFVRNFWKGLARIPGKARYEGFQMSVIGRFGGRWGQVLLDIAKLILITRFMPPELRKMARFPIPKPGKSNEYRPISLCNDLYCYINAVTTSYSSLGIEKSNILHEGMCAYRRGRGCSSLVTTELCFREDCNEQNLPVLQLDEDEEKFFDRVPVEILLAAMRTNGFPCQGFLELKASSMQEKLVEIITSKGIAHARFVCRLEQGNPDSPTVSNLVIKLKHNIWQHMTIEASKRMNTTSESGAKYAFNSVDPEDGQITLCRIGYCDDNSKFCCVKDENDLFFLAKYFIQLSGDLSMVTKIGRKSSKCELQFFNVSANFAKKLEKCWSTAWSYVNDGPVEECVPIKIHMKDDERRKFYESVNYFDLDELEQSKWDKIIHPKAHKHLGLKCTLGGDTTASGRDTLNKIKERLGSLNVHAMGSKAQIKCVNMLCSTMHSYVPLQVGYKGKDLAELDHVISGNVLKRHGITTSDCRHRLYLPENLGGVGFISLLDQDIISVARELEIVSNLPFLEGETFRTRIRAIHNYNPNDNVDIINHARFSIRKLARYGLFLQDKNDDIINNILAKLNDKGKFPSIGTPHFKDGNRYSMSIGKEKNVALSLGGSVHKALSLLRENKWNSSPIIEDLIRTSRISKKMLLETKDLALQERFDSTAGIFSFWEWHNDHDLTLRAIPHLESSWKYFDVAQMLKNKFPYSYLDFEDAKIKLEAQKLVEIKGWNTSSSGGLSNLFNGYDDHQSIFRKVMLSNVPLLISTDGAHELCNDNKDERVKSSAKTTSAFVISLPDIREGESLDTRQWEGRPTIPLLSRSILLPQYIGTTESDIATGELFALAMSELALHQQLPRVIITDSKSTRDLLLECRNNDSTIVSDRSYIRKTSGGVSKFIFDLFQTKFCNINLEESTEPIPTTLQSSFQDAMKLFCEIAKTWTDNKEEFEEVRNNVWEKEYWDFHKDRSIWKVNSHQLDETGSNIRHQPRYPKLIPNLCILSTNHHADICADFAKTFSSKPININIASSYMRFSLMWNGKTIDRHVSMMIRNAIALERVKRLKCKPTQGLLWRVIDQIDMDWKDFQAQQGLFRSMLGLSRTHSRSIYKSESYRNNCKTIRVKSSQNPTTIATLKSTTNLQKIVDLTSSCMWCNNSALDNVTMKGNRKHALLTCTNVDLHDFRKDMRVLLNQKLRDLFLHLASNTSFSNVSNICRKIEAAFIFHQKMNSCRLKNIPPYRRNSYIPIADLLNKWEHKTIFAAIQDADCRILLEIFGIIPKESATQHGDEELGLVDTPWLGLIPSFLDNIMDSACQNLGISENHETTRLAVTSKLARMWTDVKSLIQGSATGLHRIIGSTGRKIEKEFAKKANTLLEDSGESIDQISLSSLSESTGTPKRTKEFITGSMGASKKIKTSDHPVKIISTNFLQSAEAISKPATKFCSGMTCGKESIFWCAGCDFTPIQIKASLKQCQRCSRHMTAFKQASSTLENLLQHPSKKQLPHLLTIIEFCRENPDNLQSRYNIFIDLLDISIPGRICKHQARYTNKSAPDRFKLICKIIHKSILHQMKKLDSADLIIKKSLSFIDNSSQSLHKALTKIKAARHIDISTPSILRSYSLISKQVGEHHAPLSSAEAIEANSPGVYLKGNAITKAVDVIRARLNMNIFIAHADAYLTIQSWEPRQGWGGIAKIFTSQRVLDEKPMGIYIIPIFSGSVSSGHWHVMVIEKRRNCCQGWQIDSLGTAADNRIMKEQLRKAFLPGRGRFIWTDHLSRSQTECECGPRTVLTMHTVESMVSAGKTTEDAVEEASMMHISTETYSADAVRLEAALLIDEHRPSMHMRLRRRSHDNTLATQQSRPKRRRKERKRTNHQPRQSQTVDIE